MIRPYGLGRLRTAGGHAEAHDDGGHPDRLTLNPWRQEVTLERLDHREDDRRSSTAVGEIEKAASTAGTAPSQAPKYGMTAVMETQAPRARA